MKKKIQLPFESMKRKLLTLTCGLGAILIGAAAQRNFKDTSPVVFHSGLLGHGAGLTNELAATNLYQFVNLAQLQQASAGLKTNQFTTNVAGTAIVGDVLFNGATNLISSSGSRLNNVGFTNGNVYGNGAGLNNLNIAVVGVTNAGTAAYSNATAFALSAHTQALSTITDAGTAGYSNATAFALATHDQPASTITNAGNMIYSNATAFLTPAQIGTAAYSNASAFALAGQAGNYSNITETAYTVTIRSNLVVDGAMNLNEAYFTNAYFYYTNAYVITNAYAFFDENGRMMGTNNSSNAYLAADQTWTGQNTVQVVPDSPTNQWTINGTVSLGTVYSFTSGAATGGITGVVNIGTTTERYAELTIVASGDIVFTNAVPIQCNDMADSRTITNGNTAVISVAVIPGICTNMAIVQFK